jgi:hypothetical protein
MVRRQIYIDSKDETDPTNFNYNLPRTISKIRAISLDQISIPVEYYSFRTGTNTIIFTDSGGSGKTATITPGNYNSTTITTIIDTVLTAVSTDTYTVTHNDATNKLTITSSNSAFIIEGTGTANKLLGWTTSSTSAAAAQTAPNVIRLYGEQYLYLKSNSLTSGSISRPISNGNQREYFAKIPIDEVYGGVVNWKNNNNHKIYYTYKTLEDLDFTLLYSDDSQVNLNGSFISLTLNIFD